MPKSIKITKAQRDAHNLKHGKTREQVQEYREQQAIKRYGEEKYRRMLRKQDVRSILVEKGTRPKGAYYDPDIKESKESKSEVKACYKLPLTSLEKLFQKDLEVIDGDTPEGQAEVRIRFFG